MTDHGRAQDAGLAERVTRLEEGQLALQADIAKLAQLVSRQGDGFSVQLDAIEKGMADWRATSGRIDWRAWAVIVAVLFPIITIAGTAILRESDATRNAIHQHAMIPAHGNVAQRLDVLETHSLHQRQEMNQHKEDTFRWLRLLGENPLTTIQVPQPTYYPE